MAASCPAAVSAEGFETSIDTVAIARLSSPLRPFAAAVFIWEKVQFSPLNFGVRPFFLPKL
jgi:hypothetical protein